MLTQLKWLLLRGIPLYCVGIAGAAAALHWPILTVVMATGGVFSQLILCQLVARDVLDSEIITRLEDHHSC